jgi:DNA repair protein RadC
MASMKTWPLRERPRERLLELGPRALSDAELVALIIGTGHGKENAVETARRAIGEAGGLESLGEHGVRRLSRLTGIGEVKAARLAAAFELGVRTVEQRAGKRVRATFHCSSDIYDAYQARLGALRQEVFLVVGLNTRNELICEVVAAKGTINECRVEPREVFRPLIAEAAARALLIHNHPSGHAAPSTYDVSLTRRLVKVGELVGIPVLDHVIIGRFDHASLRDLGLIMEFESTG